MIETRCHLYVKHPWEDMPSYNESFASIPIACERVEAMKRAYADLGYHNLERAEFQIRFKGIENDPGQRAD